MLEQTTPHRSPSWRLKLLSAYMRRFKRPKLARMRDQHDMREDLDHAARIPPKPPSYMRFTHERLSDELLVEWVRSENLGQPPSTTILYFHGGAYVAGSPQTHRNITWRLAEDAKAQVAAVDYRLAPENPFPAAIDDACAAYQALLSRGVPAQSIALAGDSAGGGLVFATLLKAQDLGLPQPGCVAAFSPFLDLTLSGDSYRRNAARDALLPSERVAEAAEAYLAGADPKNPYASPIFGEFKTPVNALIQVGSSEILHDDAERMSHKLRDLGGDVRLEIWRGAPHGLQFAAPYIPESLESLRRCASFIQRRSGNAHKNKTIQP